MSDFKPIPGFDGYVINQDGQVRNTTTDRVCGTEEIHCGYLRVHLKGPSGWKKKLVHRLVMETFAGASELDVNHEDGNKHNNNIANLKYVTHAENIQHAYDTGLKRAPRELQSGNGKLLETEVTIINALRGEMPQHAIGKLFGVSQARVAAIHKAAMQ